MSQDPTVSDVPSETNTTTETKVKKTRDDWDEVHKLVRNLVFATLGVALFALWMLQYNTLPSVAQNFTPIVAVALMGAAGVRGLSGTFRR